MKVSKKVKVVLLSIAMILLVNFIYVKLTSRSVFVKNDDTPFFVKYLIVNEEKVSKSAKIDDIFSDEDTSEILYNSFARVYLKKNGTNYVGKLNNVNRKIKDNITDYVFALNDINGNVIEDAKFDIKTKEIVIPEKYYDSKNKFLNIHMQVMSRVSENEIKNIKVSTYINNKKKITYENTYEKSSKFSLDKALVVNRIRKSDISIVINDIYQLSSKDFTWDYKANVVKLNVEPVIIDNIKIYVKKKSIVENVFGYLLNTIPVFANYDIDAYLKIEAPAPSSVHTNDTFKYNTYNRDTSNEEGGHSISIKYNPYSSQAAAANDAEGGGSVAYLYGDGYILDNYTSGDTRGRKASRIEENWYENYGTSSGSSALVEFKVKLPSSLTNNSINHGTDENPLHPKIKFGNAAGKWIALLCGHSSAKAEGSEPFVIDVTVLNIDNSDNEMTLLFEMPAKYNNQFGYGIYKFYWTENGKLTVQKTDATNNNAAIADNSVQYKLYGKSNCSGTVLKSATTNANGKVTFKNLTCNKTYYVKETNLGNLACNYTYVNQCISKKITCSGTVSTDGYYANSTDFPNRRRFYCIKGLKRDVDGNSINGITFSYGSLSASSGGTPAHASYSELSSTPNENGMAIFDMLSCEDGLAMSESSPTGTKATWNQNNTLYYYWNNSAAAFNGTKTEMTYGTDGKYTCPSDATATPKDNSKVFYCARALKEDADTKEKLPGATFTAYRTYADAQAETNAVYTATSDGDGVASFYYGTDNNGGATYSSGSFYVKETAAPSGYVKSSEIKEIGVTVMDSSTTSSTYTSSNLCSADASAFPYEDTSLTINWYKTDENSNKIEGAQFKVKKGDTVIYHKTDKVETIDSTGVKRMCYTATTTSQGDNSDIFIADSEGQVCVRGVDEGSYTVTETLPSQYHAFGKSTTKTIDASGTFDVRDDSENESNKFVNVPTGFRFTKTVKADDGADNDDKKIVINGEEKSITKLNTEELKKIDFEVYVADANGNPTGNPLKFIKNDETGIYEYSEDQTQTIHGTTGTVVSILHLDDNRQIAIDHLPWDSSTHEKKYVIREVQSKVCDSTKSEEDCIGYYYPDYKAQASTFTITPCSYDKDIVNATSCPTGGFATQTLQNTPTLFEFTKKDLYGYDDQADVQDKNRDKDESETTVEFENDKERSDFDRIDFRVKDSNGNYMNFIYMGNSGSCTDPNSYSIYKYVPGLQLPDGVAADVFNNTELGITQTVHACGGHIHFTNLCRGNTYTVYEDEVPSDSVFVRETVQEEPKTSVSTTIPCTEKENQEKTSSTAIISDKPTYFEVQKRDSKYNYLIPDEAATFRLYQCEKGTECHPTDVADDPTTEEDERLTATNVRRVIKFYDRGALVNNENQNINEETSKDHENSEGDLLDVQVYRAMSDSDADNNTNYVTDVHPYLGRLVFRYLQSGYNYVLVETRAPKNYMLPIGQSAETKFTVVSTTVDVEAKDTPNVPTSLLIRKYDKDGDKLLAGAEFKIYKAQNQCNFNQDPWSQVGLKEVKLKTIRDGVYEARPETDTSTIRTCLDKEGALCSEIPTNTQTRLTDLEYAVGSETANEEDTWADFENILYKSEENGVTKTEKINLQEGEALVQYLEYGNCYVIEETKAPTGYSLPKKKKDRFTMVQIDDNEQYGHDTSKIFKNTPTPFTFFKYDEFNQPLDGAEFKLQKLNDDKKYEDIAVTEEEKEGELFYKYEGLAEENSNTVMHTNGGKATVYYLPVGQYRIVETKAAPGKELTKNPNIATFFVDDAGNTFGNALVVNKAETKKIIPKNSASAELIVNIQTGQVVIRYGSIILTIVGLIIGLMLLKKKTK